jgi:hypothetical protein
MSRRNFFHNDERSICGMCFVFVTLANESSEF